MKSYQKPIMTIHNLTSEERIGACKQTSNLDWGPISGGSHCSICVDQLVSGSPVQP